MSRDRFPNLEIEKRVERSKRRAFGIGETLYVELPGGEEEMLRCNGESGINSFSTPEWPSNFTPIRRKMFARVLQIALAKLNKNCHGAITSTCYGMELLLYIPQGGSAKSSNCLREISSNSKYIL